MRLLKSLSALAVLVAALAVAPVAEAALSASYGVLGTEIGATSTTGTFVGVAHGAGSDSAVWRARVDHQALSASCLQTGCAITAGTFSLTNQRLNRLSGTFTSGTVTLSGQAPGCGSQTFTVSGTIATAGGPVRLNATLTHHRTLLFGTCTTYGATVKGSLALR